MHNKAYLFIGISALIHFSVIGIISQQINELTPVEHGRSAISVEITQSKNTIIKQATAKTKPASIKQTVAEKPDKPDQKSASVIKNITADSTSNLNITQDITSKNHQISESLITKTKNPNSTTPVNNDQDEPDEINTEAIIAVLQKELSKYFYYPKSAQRKNWQGLVILSFTIMPDGVIHKIQVNKSSGYDVLDNAAVEALEEVKKHEELALALNGNSHEQLLPVNYKLTN